MVFSHLKVVNSFTTIYYVLLRINTHPPRQIWQVQSVRTSHAASGRRWPAQNHAFIAYLRVPSPRPGTNLNQALVEDAFTSAAFKIEGPGGGGDSWWACWQDSAADTFWLGRWLLSPQPPSLPLFPTHPSRTRTLVPSPFVLASWARQFKFVIASRSESLAASESSFRLRPIGPPSSRLVSPRDDAGRGDAAGVCRAAPVAALLGPLRLAELDNVSRASRHCPWRLTGHQSHQPLVFSAAAMAHRDRPSVTVVPVVSTPIQVMRSAGCWQRRPSVPTTTHRPLVAPKV